MKPILGDRVQKNWGAGLVALGIVFGDIGTSPLYAVRVCFRNHPDPITSSDVHGILSLIFWSLMIVVSIKYLLLVMRADNQGEGGILALALSAGNWRREFRLGVVMVMGLFGAGLLYGDGLITPAISVLSAVEGIEVVWPSWHSFVLPISVAILVALFLIQPYGTAKIGRLFGPIMLLWFVTIGALGLRGIWVHPEILLSLNPRYAFEFLWSGGWGALFVLGGVFLVVTGGEALYADMGHVGRAPIRIAWFVVVLPALVLNYFGQGAWVLSDAAAIDNPFFQLAPPGTQLPLVFLAAIATTIASQAVITGVFSLTSQAVQVGLLPPMEIRHTSVRDFGQVEVPALNWMLMVVVVLLAVVAGKSERLAGAYGIAITTTMGVTTLLLLVVMRQRWHWPLWLIVGMGVPLLVVDATFFVANAGKMLAGGWFPLFVGLTVYAIMLIWQNGMRSIRLQQQNPPLSDATTLIQRWEPLRTERPAIYLIRHLQTLPHAFVSNVANYRTIHHPIAFVSIQISNQPWVPLDQRIEEQQLSPGIIRIKGTFGFKQRLNVPDLMQLSEFFKLAANAEPPVYFVNRVRLVRNPNRKVRRFDQFVFAFLHRNSGDPIAYFLLPEKDVIEIGERIQL